MRSTRRTFAALTLVVSSLLASASAQLTIDATGPVHGMTRKPQAGRGGSTGRRLPLRVTIAPLWPSASGERKFVIQFTVTNESEGDLVLPTSPNPGDFEPKDPTATYTVSRLSLYLTPSRNDASSPMLPGAELYGNKVMAGTLLTLAPKQSMRVLATVDTSSIQKKDGTLIARISLVTETVKSIDGKPFSDTDEIGSASSQEYPVESLFK